MKANKVTLEIKIECLSPDTLGGLLADVSQELLDNQKVKGEFSHEDGDHAEWSLKTETVEF